MKFQLPLNRLTPIHDRPRQLTWVTDEQPGHCATDAAPQSAITFVGQINTVDAVKLGSKEQINVARKPSFSLGFTTASDPLSGGYFYDRARARDLTADSVGIDHLLLKRSSALAHPDFQATMFAALVGSRAAHGLNGDGNANLLWRSAANGQTVLWTMNGVEPASSRALGILGADWTALNRAAVHSRPRVRR